MRAVLTVNQLHHCQQAPQGSVLSTYIFNAGTYRSEEGFEHVNHHETYELDDGDLTFLDVASDLDRAHSTRVRDSTVLESELSPISREHDFVILPIARPKPITVEKIVDDIIQNEKIHIKKTPTYYQQDKLFKKRSSSDTSVGTCSIRGSVLTRKKRRCQPYRMQTCMRLDHTYVR